MSEPRVCSPTPSQFAPEHPHSLTFTARWLRWLAWPTRTQTFERECTCHAAQSVAEQLRDGGAKVRVVCGRPRRVVP